MVTDISQTNKKEWSNLHRKIDSKKRTFIVRHGSGWWRATNVTIDEDSISFWARKMRRSEISTIEAIEQRPSARVKRYESEIFDQVDIFASSSAFIGEDECKVSLSDLEKIVVYDQYLF